MDLLVVATNTTPGLRRDFEELLAALRPQGLTLAVATSDFGLLARWRDSSLALNELVVTGSVRRAVRRALRGRMPRGVIVTTSTGAGLLPVGLLSRAAIRFDGLAVGTRLRRRDAVSRALERRVLRHARMALPYSSLAAGDLARLEAGPHHTVIWPSPVRPGPEPLDERWPAALCYANDPAKKGLDIAVAAWARAARAPYRLLVTGIEAEAGRRFLRRRGIEPPSSVEWLGRLPEHEYRRISACVSLYLGTSRVDQFATTQLEALLDGALLVTGPSEGPMEALSLANALDKRLVATSITPEAVAAAIGVAMRTTPDEQAAYRARARSLLAPYSREAFARTLRERVLPTLLGPHVGHG